MESITHLAGFDWRTNIALLGGFAAKEVLVSTLERPIPREVDPEKANPYPKCWRNLRSGVLGLPGA
jgi:ferrous iron transport protein B